jgi:hypothetical protein
MLPLSLIERLLLCCTIGGEVGAPALHREFVSRPKNITVSLSSSEGVMVRCLIVGGWSERLGCMAIPGSD